MLKTTVSLFIALAPFACLAQRDTVKQVEPDGRVYIKIVADSAIAEEGYMINGLTDGSWMVYYSNGKPKITTAYARGKKNGVCLKMTDEGILEYIEHYKDDKLHGGQKIYGTNTGKLMLLVNYKEGIRHGLYQKYYDDGQLQEQVVYDNGKKNGLYQEFHDNGKLKQTMEYNYGVQMGKHITSNRGGRVIGDITYKDDKMNGAAIFYFTDGDVKEQGGYKNGVRSGYWKEYKHGGVREEEGMYVNGEKDGEWKEYLNGILERTTIYNGGKVVSSR